MGKIVYFIKENQEEGDKISLLPSPGTVPGMASSPLLLITLFIYNLYTMRTITDTVLLSILMIIQMVKPEGQSPTPTC